jgi:effector-binding domain-containing protein
MSPQMDDGPPVVAEPRLQRRAAQHYAAVTGIVTRATIPAIADRLGEVFAHLSAHGIAPAGPPFLRYRSVDTREGGELVIEAAVPTDGTVAEDGAVFTALLPAGRYAVARHVGPPSALAAATAELFAWGRRRGLTWDVHGTLWGARLEVLLTDPRQEPDPAHWVTELAVRLADESR